MNRIDWSMLCVVVAAFILIPLTVAGSIRERHEWEEFRIAHKCRVVAEMPSEFFNTFDGKRVGIGATAAKQGWLCDDGITYYKEK